MGYRPTRIQMRQAGRFSFYAYLIQEDDGLPVDECPVHGWDGPPRNEFGTQLREPGVDLDGCLCPIAIGLDLQEEPFHGFTHKRAWRKAYRKLKKG